MKVGTTEYKAKDRATFTEQLRTQLGEGYPRVAALLGEIVHDFFREKLTFTDWPAVLEEVAIRNVGYRVEAKMRELMVANHERHERQKASVAADRERAREDMVADRTKPFGDRRFKTDLDKVDFEWSLDQVATNGLLQHGPASYMTKYHPTTRGLELFRWVIGEREEEPLKMNCWEAVIFALVKTGLVDKTYLGWCNSKGKPEDFIGTTDKDASFILLFQQLITNMDGYWGKESGDRQSIFEKYASKKQANQGKFRVPPLAPYFSVPQKKIIPRGRILLFGLGAHIAISTGKIVPITDAQTQMCLKLKEGHGILELDGMYHDEAATFSIREGYFEEFYVQRRRHYLTSLVVAPFPKCITAGRITLTGIPYVSVEHDPEVIAAIEAFWEKDDNRAKKAAQYQAAEKACADRIAELEKTQKSLMVRRDALVVQQGVLAQKVDPPATDEEKAQVSAEIRQVETRLTDIEDQAKNAQSQLARDISKITTEWRHLLNADPEVMAKRATAEARAESTEPETIEFAYNVNDPYVPREG